MRFKKGSRVEVMNKKDVPMSWRLAEIISGNGHTYNLRYHGHQGVDKVSRKFIRPCPPAAKGIQNWVAGDIVEVFDDCSWKIATVSKCLDEGHFSVRPHGLSHEICVSKSHIRVRQSWQDGQWVPVGKISGSYGDVKFNKRVKPNSCPKFGFQFSQKEGNCFPVYNDTKLQESHVVSSKTLKRASPFRSYTLEGKAKKFKAAEKDRSLEKGRNWRHTSLASKGPNKILGSAAFLLEKAVGHFQHPFATDKTVCCPWHLSEKLKSVAH